MSAPTSIAESFDQVITHLQTELATIRTNRATPALVEHLKVVQYGAQVELRTVAAISSPEPRLLVIQPWDPALVIEIEKAIRLSPLGINPVNDGHLIRLSLPQLTTERRHELVKVVREREERARVSIRSLREEMLKELRRKEKEQHRSEDATEREIAELQKDVDRANESIHNMTQGKIHEIETIE